MQSPPTGSVFNLLGVAENQLRLPFVEFYVWQIHRVWAGALVLLLLVSISLSCKLLYTFIKYV